MALLPGPGTTRCKGAGLARQQREGWREAVFKRGGLASWLRSAAPEWQAEASPKPACACSAVDVFHSHEAEWQPNPGILNNKGCSLAGLPVPALLPVPRLALGRAVCGAAGGMAAVSGGVCERAHQRAACPARLHLETPQHSMPRSTACIYVYSPATTSSRHQPQHSHCTRRQRAQRLSRSPLAGMAPQQTHTRCAASSCFNARCASALSPAAASSAARRTVEQQRRAAGSR